MSRMTAQAIYRRMSILRVCSSRILIVIILSLIWGFRPHLQGTVEAQGNQPAKAEVAGTEASSNSAHSGPDGYVGSAGCAHCHLDIYTSFSRTHMGRSLTPVTPALLKTLSIPEAIFSEKLNRHFEVFGQDGKLYQSDSQTGTDGREVFRNTAEVGWIIGAGTNGFGALVKRGDYLFEAPLSFYSRAKDWELSPGYESKNASFDRQILAGCIFCHSGQPTPVDEMTGKLDSTAHPPAPIGCENCHGPGAAHIQAMKTKGTQHSGPMIVNPDRLSAALENDICMSCHEDGDSRVPRPGKTFRDFRPGTPLDDTFSILMVPRKRDSPDDSDHVQHYYAMTMSRCYRASAGQLRCATCHDPHFEPSETEAPAYFNQKCIGCHASKVCTLPLQARQQTIPADNCIGCHMPKRAASQFAHSSLTNHRILARPGEPWPEEAYQQTTASLPDLVYLNRVPGRPDDIPALSLLEAYRVLSEHRPEYLAPYLKILSELEQSEPDHASVQLALGIRDLKAGGFEKAIEHFQHSLQLDPQQPLAYSSLSEALAGSGQIAEAIAASDEAIALAPYNGLLQRALIERLIAGRQYQRAEAAMEQYVKEFPEDDFMRKMLAMAKQ